MSFHVRDRVLVFDYGEVISRGQSEPDRLAMLSIAGILVADSHDTAAEPFWTSYWARRPDLDRGTLSTTAYWTMVGAELGTNWRASEIQALWAADFRSWISVDADVVDLIAALHEAGTRMALLSNASFEFGSPFRYAPTASYFERIFVSAELDLIKPDSAIYLHVAEAMRIDPSQMVFIDNRRVNTDAAAELGITVHHFTGAAELRAFIGSIAS